MATPTKARQQAAPPVDEYDRAAQAGVASSPELGKRNTYLRLPAGLKFFEPVANRTYRLLILGHTAGKYHDPALEPGQLEMILRFMIHGYIGADPKSYLCVQSMYGQKCAICEEYARRKGGRKLDDAEYAALRNYRPQNRDARLIHDLDGEKDNLQVWEEASNLFDKYFTSMIADRPQFRKYGHPKEGCIIEVKGSEKQIGKSGKCTEYASILPQKFGKDVGLEQMPAKLVERARKIVLSDFLYMPPDFARLTQLCRGHVPAEVNGHAETEPASEIVEEVTEAQAEDHEFAGEEVVEEAVTETPEPEEEAVEEAVEETIEEEITEEIVEEVIEEEPEPEPTIEIGSGVTLKLGGKDVTGEVTKLDGDSATVKVGTKSYKVKVEKLTLA